jgi:hypothetical protein
MDDTLGRLRRIIVAHCNLEELRTLCFDLGVNYDEFGGERLSAKVRELLAYLERRGRIPDLIATSKRLRPDIVADTLRDLEPVFNLLKGSANKP